MLKRKLIQWPVDGDLSDMIVTTKQAANLLGISARKLQLAQKAGWIDAQGRGRWNLKEVNAGLARERQDTERRASKSASASRVTDARTRQIELSIQQKEGELISLDEVNQLFDYMTGVYLTELSGIPASITRQVRERKRIETIIDQKRQRIAEVFRKARVDTAPSIGDDRAVGSNGTRRMGRKK